MGQLAIPINPTTVKFNAVQNIVRWAQSIYNCLNAGITLAQGRGSDSSGVYNTFTRTNGDGIMVRIGAAAGTEPIKWNGTTSDASITISLLGRKPTGWIICDVDKACTIFRSGPMGTTTLTLRTSDITCSATVWVF